MYSQLSLADAQRPPYCHSSGAFWMLHGPAGVGSREWGPQHLWARVEVSRRAALEDVTLILR